MSTRPALPNLTTIRLVAALYVFCYHMVPASHFYLGNTGVNLFFVLSGFILAYVHPEVNDKRHFYALRFARIYPLYALSLLLALPQFLRSAGAMLPKLVGTTMAFLLLQTWWPPYRNVVNSVAWTLPIEACFYLLFPFLVPWALRRVNRWKTWIAVLAAVMLVPPAIVDFLLVPAHPHMEETLRIAMAFPLFRMAEFVVGMMFGLRFLEHRPTFGSARVALATAMVVVCTVVCYRISWDYRDLLLNGLLSVPYGVLLYVLAGWKSRWFAHPLLQLGGEISYGIYLLQFSANSALRIALHRAVPPWPAVLLLLVVASYLSYRFFEKPARRAILKMFGYRASAKPIPTPGLST